MRVVLAGTTRGRVWGVAKGLTQDPAGCESIVTVTAGHTLAVVSCFEKANVLKRQEEVLMSS